jgi:hypothetical protein
MVFAVVVAVACFWSNKENKRTPKKVRIVCLEVDKLFGLIWFNSLNECVQTLQEIVMV